MEHTQDADEEQVRAAIGGDESAFELLAGRYRRELHVHCYRMLGSFEEAEDRVQEVFIRAWTKRSTYAGTASFRAWLYRIGTNACLELLRKKSRTEVSLERLEGRLALNRCPGCSHIQTGRSISPR